MKLKLLAAVGILGTIASAGVASAATYDFGTIQPGGTYTSNTLNHGAGDFTDTFDFQLTSPLTEFSTAAFTEAAPFAITSADLTLYNASNVALATTGAFDPQTDRTPTLSEDLTAGAYHIVADITVPSGFIGSYTVTATALSAAPEPKVWLLMIGGVFFAGFALRRGWTKGLLTPKAA